MKSAPDHLVQSNSDGIMEAEAKLERSPLRQQVQTTPSSSAGNRNRREREQQLDRCRAGEGHNSFIIRKSLEHV